MRVQTDKLNYTLNVEYQDNSKCIAKINSI